MYICTKAMKLNGEAYFPGDPVPDSAIQPGRAGKLIACGYISESETAKEGTVSKSEEKRIKAQTGEEKTEPAEVVPDTEEKPKKKKAKKEV